MWLLIIGLLCLLMKWFEVGPVANWSWWLVISPFLAAMFWFEVLEPMLGLDKKKMHDNVEKIKQERTRKAWSGPAASVVRLRVAAQPVPPD